MERKKKRRTAASKAAEVTSLSDVVQDDAGVAASQLPPGFRVPKHPGAYACMIGHLMNTRVFLGRPVDDAMRRCLMPFTALPWSLDTRLDESVAGLAVVLRGAGFTPSTCKKLIMEYVSDNIDEIYAREAIETVSALWQRVWGTLQNRVKSEVDAFGANPFTWHTYALQQGSMGPFADGRMAQYMPAPGYAQPGVPPRASAPEVTAPPFVPTAGDSAGAAPGAAPRADSNKKTITERAVGALGDAALSGAIGAATAPKGKRMSAAAKNALGTMAAEVVGGEAAEAVEGAAASAAEEEKKK